MSRCGQRRGKERASSCVFVADSRKECCDDPEPLADLGLGAQNGWRCAPIPSPSTARETGALLVESRASPVGSSPLPGCSPGARAPPRTGLHSPHGSLRAPSPPRNRRPYPAGLVSVPSPLLRGSPLGLSRGQLHTSMGAEGPPSEAEEHGAHRSALLQQSCCGECAGGALVVPQLPDLVW